MKIVRLARNLALHMTVQVGASQDLSLAAAINPTVVVLYVFNPLIN